MPTNTILSINKINFNREMRRESLEFDEKYLRKTVKLILSEQFLDYKSEGGVLMFIHTGSFFLSGAALILSQCIKYTAVASTHNLQYLPSKEKKYWLNVHRNANNNYSRPMFLTNDSKRGLLEWVNDANFIGVAPDVNEKGKKQKTDKFLFLGKYIYLQTAPARIAQATGKKLYPMTIRWNAEEKFHELFVGKPSAQGSIFNVIQDALIQIEPIIENHDYQLFHDLNTNFCSDF